MLKCASRWLRVVWPHSATGPRIPYTAAQVAARRKAQMVLVTTCTMVGGGGGIVGIQHLPPAWLGLPPPAPRITSYEPAPPVWVYQPPAPTWRATGEPVHAVPEPPTWPLLAIGIVGLVAVRNWRRHGRTDWFMKDARR